MFKFHYAIAKADVISFIHDHRKLLFEMYFICEEVNGSYCKSVRSYFLHKNKLCNIFTPG
jgi:hypothetical protein